MSATPPAILGIDFSSAPSRRKPITVARGRAEGGLLMLDRIDELPTLAGFEALLAEPGPWIGGFDFPFGWPRELALHEAWPGAADDDWRHLMAHSCALDRPALRERFRAFCAARPAGGKFAHRATDRLAGSSPSMKWVNPPVAWMLHAGVPRLIAAGVSIPGLLAGDPARVALEAYPGVLARFVTRDSYKSDDRRRHTRERAAVRARLLAAACAGELGLEVRLRLGEAEAAALIEDGSGDRLDALLCALQAAAARLRPGWGLPVRIDPLEGWIAGLPLRAEAAA
ncbi:DUF429 domain-containing protein [Derxia gummosa]|uniref:DUF429 domain-containing protein n=1 Tax=Derxia gummosa DSM 723 TaxID=1121388 RepID=A0A8B6X816_9BURK|nr:DUF429 domain-containing protein [Derxia gummosa]